MKISTEKIIKEIVNHGEITEREILLLKRRACNGDEAAKNFTGPVPVTAEQSEKGYKWLYNLYKTPHGRERKNNPFTGLQESILDNYHGQRFTFEGWYYDGNGFSDHYEPIYNLCGLRYCVTRGNLMFLD